MSKVNKVVLIEIPDKDKHLECFRRTRPFRTAPSIYAPPYRDLEVHRLPKDTFQRSNEGKGNSGK